MNEFRKEGEVWLTTEEAERIAEAYSERYAHGLVLSSDLAQTLGCSEAEVLSLRATLGERPVASQEVEVGEVRFTDILTAVGLPMAVLFLAISVTLGSGAQPTRLTTAVVSCGLILGVGILVTCAAVQIRQTFVAAIAILGDPKESKKEFAFERKEILATMFAASGVAALCVGATLAFFHNGRSLQGTTLMDMGFIWSAVVIFCYATAHFAVTIKRLAMQAFKRRSNANLGR